MGSGQYKFFIFDGLEYSSAATIITDLNSSSNLTFTVNYSNSSDSPNFKITCDNITNYTGSEIKKYRFGCIDNGVDWSIGEFTSNSTETIDIREYISSIDSPLVMGGVHCLKFWC
jgi:hypothetical protein